MKKLALLTTGLLASLLTAQAQVFTQGNIAVLRIGGTAGQNALSTGDGTTVFIDQYNPAGTGSLVSSYAVPSSGGNALILSGESYEGYLTLTPDGNHLVFAGYNTTAPASSELIDVTAAAVPRAVATLDAYDNYLLPIINHTNFNGFAINGAASDGTNYWMTGTGPSSLVAPGYVVYSGTAAAGASTQIVPGIISATTGLFGTGCRSINLFNNALYVCGYTTNSWEQTGVGVGGYMLSNISGALPTTLTGYTNVLPTGTENNSTASDLAINPAGTVAYLADDFQGGVIKFTYSGGVWTSNYTIPMTNTGYTTTSGKNAISVAADWTQTPVVLYATTGESYTNRLVKLQDAGTSASANSTLVNLAYGNAVTGSGGYTNTFRGVRLAPFAYPYFSVPPTPFFGLPGATATFSATVLGVPTPTYQWYSNSPANPTYVAIPGATSTNLTLANISQSQSGSLFTLVAVNTHGTSSNTPVSLTVQNPAITGEPVGATNLVGSPGVTLSVSAIGSGNLTYQWLANGVAIANATSSTFTVPSSTVSNAASYTVIVTNTAGASVTSVTSAPPTVVSYSEYLLYDTFSYANGNLIGDPGSPWTDIVDTPVFLETNGRVQLTQTNTGDAQSLFIVSNVQNTVIWSSFIINLSTLPASPNGVYFANLEDTNYGFFPAIYILTSNAFPGTYRLGISTTNVNYSDGKGGPDHTGIIPVDLAPGIDYQVVYAFDMTANDVAYLAINPNVTTDVNTSSFEGDPNTAYTTTQALPTNGLSAAGLRQYPGEGIFQIDNLEVSLDTTVGSATICGLCAVTAGITPQAPAIGLQPVGFTNYPGGSNVMEVAASAIGSGITPNYYWYMNTPGSPGTYTQIQDGGDVTGSSTAAITLSDEVASDAGTYYVVVSNSVGGTQSASVVASVITTPTAPFFITPTNATTNTIGIDSSVTFTASAEGSGPLTYEWFFNNGTNNTDTGVSGPTLNLTSVALNQSGTYTVVATGTTSPAAVSSNFVLIVTPPVVTTIGYLNSLMTISGSTPSLAASNTTTEYTVTGTVVVATNLTAAADSEYYVQDSTGGIDFYVGGDASFRPVMGDVVTVTGVLSLYFDTLELTSSTGNASETYVIISNTPTPPNVSPVPPKVIPVGYTSSQPASSITNYEGTFVTLTNVYFEGAGGVFASEADVVVTNKAGVSYGVTVYPGEEGAGAPLTSIIGEPIPAFAYSVSGALNEYSTTDWELDVTRYSDIVTAPPPPVTNLTAAASGVGGTNIALTWTSVPYQYTYSVWSSTNVTGPYTPLQSGLWFGGSNAAFTNIGPKNATMFYEIVSP